ncbi:hypothetical protein BG005_007116, partial [Podila minutissima]
MLRSSFFVVLALLFLQVALALSIEPGTYYIESDDGLLLSVGPVPLIYPPPDVPVRLFERGSPFDSKWEVRSTEDGGLLISTRSSIPQFDYRIVNRNGEVYVSATQKTPQIWSVTSVGGGQFDIKLPYEDEVFTSDYESFPQVTLQAAEGLPNQKWNFIRVDRDNNYR